MFLFYYGRRRRRSKAAGKKIVYITPYRNIAYEMKRSYEEEGEKTVVETENDPEMGTMYLVRIYP